MEGVDIAHLTINGSLTARKCAVCNLRATSYELPVSLNRLV
jgi:hypothetical protein